MATDRTQRTLIFINVGLIKRRFKGKWGVSLNIRPTPPPTPNPPVTFWFPWLANAPLPTADDYNFPMPTTLWTGVPGSTIQWMGMIGNGYYQFNTVDEEGKHVSGSTGPEVTPPIWNHTIHGYDGNSRASVQAFCDSYNSQAHPTATDQVSCDVYPPSGGVITVTGWKLFPQSVTVTFPAPPPPDQSITVKASDYVKVKSFPFDAECNPKWGDSPRASVSAFASRPGRVITISGDKDNPLKIS